MPAQLSPWRVWDALYIHHHTPGFPCLGREDVLSHIARTLQRTDVQHVIIVGKAGSGKTTLIRGLAAVLLERRFAGLRQLPLLQFDTHYLARRLTSSAEAATILTYFEQALAALPPALVVFDDMTSLLQSAPDEAGTRRIMTALTGATAYHALLFFSAETWGPIENFHRSHLNSCEIIQLDELDEPTCRTIVQERARFMAGRHRLRLHPDVPDAAFAFSQQLSGSAQPQRALSLLEETCAAVAVSGQSIVSRADVASLFSQRIGQTTAVLDTTSPERVRSLRRVVSQAVIGQAHVVETVIGVIERAWLGLKNPQRPLGSFLFLGPSGVGKTELARVIAREVYGNERAFIRIDMSEYGQPHSVQRLIGAPPGYVGHEAGGQLTSAVAKHPFSLILLDEIEKADPSVFDIFLQILEDGRLTDGQGTTVDFRQTILIATSNLGVEKIIAGWLRNEPVTEPSWRQQQLMPVLTGRFRLEFLNRFEGLTVFTPLSEQALVDIAHLEVQKITERLKHHQVQVHIPPAVLKEKVRTLSDPRFGARPLKRWLENTVEEQLAHHLLSR